MDLAILGPDGWYNSSKVVLADSINVGLLYFIRNALRFHSGSADRCVFSDGNIIYISDNGDGIDMPKEINLCLCATNASKLDLLDAVGIILREHLEIKIISVHKGKRFTCEFKLVESICIRITTAQALASDIGTTVIIKFHERVNHNLLEECKSHFRLLCPNLYQLVLSTPVVDIFHAIGTEKKNQQCILVNGERFSTVSIAAVFVYDFKSPTPAQLDSLNYHEQTVFQDCSSYFMKVIDDVVSENFPLLKDQREFPGVASCEFAYPKTRLLMPVSASSSKKRGCECISGDFEHSESPEDTVRAAERKKSLKYEAFMGDKVYCLCAALYLGSAEDINKNDMTIYSSAYTHFVAVDSLAKYHNEFGVSVEIEGKVAKPSEHVPTYTSHARQKLWRYFCKFGLDDTCETLLPVFDGLFKEWKSKA